MERGLPLRQQLAALDADGGSDRAATAILAFLENALGVDAQRAGDSGEAARRFQAAIELDPHAVPAYLNLGDVRLAQGDDRRRRSQRGNGRSTCRPDRAYLAFDRLQATLSARARTRTVR